ncbi:histidine phosphatase family protein [Ruegeria sp. MALMAid1280]
MVVNPEIAITDWGLSEVGRARADAFATAPIMASVSAIWSSTERKAEQTAAILARPHGLQVKLNPALGENDRSATGFLPPSRFEAAAGAFFAAPDVSFRGWETAMDAQARIVRAITSIMNAHDGGDLAIVTHGAVGTLLWCHFSDVQIGRQHDQPGQGHYWSADLDTLCCNSGWRPIA